jgi:signal transduction histidine kinase
MEDWERLINELRAEVSLREQELGLLHEIDLWLLSPEQPAAELFTFIVNRLTNLLQADHTTILLRRSTFLEPMYSTLPSVIGQRVPISESLAGLCLESDSPINVPDVPASPRLAKYRPLRGYQGPPIHSSLATPIIVRDTVVGVLNTESAHAGFFRPVHEKIAAAVAASIAIALQRTQMLASSALFADLDRMLFASGDSQEIIQTALERVMAELQRLEHVGRSDAQIMFLRGDNRLEIVHSTNPKDVGLILGIDYSVAGRAVRKRMTVTVGDVSQDPEFLRMPGSTTIQSEIAVPILFGEDEIVIGALAVQGEEKDAFSGFYRIVLESFAEKVRTMLAFARLRADVTEALELRSADELLIAVGDQTSHLVHRLNTIVGAIRMRVQELREMQQEGRLEGSDFLSDSLAALENLADRALEMPNEMARTLSQDSTTIDVNKCIRDVLDRLDIPGDIELDLHLADDIPPLPLYRFNIVVQNIIQNAIDAMPSGGKLTVSTLTVLSSLETGYFQLVVKDTGVGMPADVRRRIFDLNFTTKRMKGEGLGLGLWWVRTFVRRARGDITVNSAVGSGTEVVVKIPIMGSGDPRLASEASH